MNQLEICLGSSRQGRESSSTSMIAFTGLENLGASLGSNRPGSNPPDTKLSNSLGYSNRLGSNLLETKLSSMGNRRPCPLSRTGSI